MSFPTYAHQLASAPVDSASILTTIEGWLASLEVATGHRVDYMAALTILGPVIVQAVLTRNPLLILSAIYANLASIFPASNPASVRSAIDAFQEETPLEFA